MPQGAGGDPTGRRAAAGVAGLALVVYLAIVGALLFDAGGQVATFARFGRQTKVYPLARTLVGDDVYAASIQGHDGQHFWVIARDPLLLDPTTVRTTVEQPGTRAGRVLYPLLVAPWRLGGEQALLWGLLVTNLVALAAGTYVASRLAQGLGVTPRAGLAFALCPTVFFGVLLDLAEVLAVASLVAFVYAVHRRRLGPAVAFAAAAVLAKESSLAIVVGVAVLAPALPRRLRVAPPAIALAAYGAWMLYQRSRLATPVDNVAFVFVPFQGLKAVMTNAWIPDHDWTAMAVGLSVFVVAAIIVIRFVRRRNLLMAAALPMALMAPFFIGEVVHQAEDAGRALGAAIVFLALDVVVARTGGRSSSRPEPLAIS